MSKALILERHMQDDGTMLGVYMRMCVCREQGTNDRAVADLVLKAQLGNVFKCTT